MSNNRSNAEGITSNILMIRPANFGYNPETAGNNGFQHQDTRLDPSTIKSLAIKEFDAFVEKLKAAGINVLVINDTDTPLKTDAVFPNNWISFHENGEVVTYPMYSPMRRLERRQEIIEELKHHFTIRRHLDLSDFEAEGRFLEGTGSMVLDRHNKIAYACLSERTNEQLLDRYCEALGYEKVLFHSVDHQGLPIYHTNVMMAMGDGFVVICLDSIPSREEKEILIKKFSDTHKEVISLSMDQLYAFAGNMLQINDARGNKYMAMSSSAYHSLTSNQIKQLENYTSIIHSDLKTIETFSGGSARCMMAEIFLPMKTEMVR